MNYREALEWIHSIGKSTGMRPGLERMHFLLDKMGNPHRHLNFVHIGGTNGKGSTASLLASILGEAGYRTGLYTSPYLESFTNRMSINGEDISHGELTEEVNSIRPLVEEVSADPRLGQVTEFEVVTALAFRYFARHNPQVVILEVGLGGRLDATNVITPLVSIITNVSREHVDYLGEDIAGIAREKAGIIKEGVPVVTAAEDPVVFQVIEEKCRQQQAPLCRVRFREGRDIGSGKNDPGGDQAFCGDRRPVEEGQYFHFYGPGMELSELFLPLLGDYQVVNASTALAALEILNDRGLPLGESHIRRGLKGVSWPGRMEVVQSFPRVVLDGAHNPAAVENLARAVREHFSYRRLILVLGILKDKDASLMLSFLAPLAAETLVTLPPIFRGTDPEEIASKARHYTSGPVLAVPEVKEAVEEALNRASTEDLVLVCGSLYVIAEARKCLV